MAAAPTDEREIAALTRPRIKLTSVFRLSDRVTLRRRTTPVPLALANEHDDAVVSDPGYITAVDVIPMAAKPSQLSLCTATRGSLELAAGTTARHTGSYRIYPRCSGINGHPID